MLGRNLKEEKRIEIPDPGGFLTLWGLDDIVLLRKFHRLELWRVDLETKHSFLTEECPCVNFGCRHDNSINNGEDRWKKLFVLN